MPDAILIMLRSLFAFFVLLLLTRLMGHKQISQLSYFDYIVGITIGSIAATLSVELENKFFDGFVSLLVWATMPILLEILALKNYRSRKVLDGQPQMIIKNGHLMEKNMAKVHYSMDDLLTQLRSKNVFNLADVEYAYLESNGQLSILKKPEKQPLTPETAKSSPSSSGLPQIVITDGLVLKKNLASLGYDENWLTKQLQKKGIKDIQDVTLAQADKTGLIYLDTRDKRNP